MKIVLDTNVLLSAFINPDGRPREVIRGCLTGRWIPIVSTGLFVEYEDVLFRPTSLEAARASKEEIEAVFNALMSVSEWHRISWLWRPNLRDEADNMVVEAAIAGDARYLVTGNGKDFKGGQLTFDSFELVSPAELLERDH